MLLEDEFFLFLFIRFNFQNIICIHVIFKIHVIILTKYLLHLKSKLYIQNYNSLYFIYFYIFEYIIIFIFFYHFRIYKYIKILINLKWKILKSFQKEFLNFKRKFDKNNWKQNSKIRKSLNLKTYNSKLKKKNFFYYYCFIFLLFIYLSSNG